MIIFILVKITHFQIVSFIMSLKIFLPNLLCKNKIKFYLFLIVHASLDGIGGRNGLKWISLFMVDYKYSQ